MRMSHFSTSPQNFGLTLTSLTKSCSYLQRNFFSNPRSVSNALSLSPVCLGSYLSLQGQSPVTEIASYLVLPGTWAKNCFLTSSWPICSQAEHTGWALTANIRWLASQMPWGQGRLKEEERGCPRASSHSHPSVGQQQGTTWLRKERLVLEQVL